MRRWIGLAVVFAAIASVALAGRASGTANATACSTEAASAAATAAGFGVDPITKRTPINSVVCGPFFGAGSQGMAATVAIPSCGISVGWGVFRLQGDRWQLVMKQNYGVLKLESLALPDGGADIRTTQGYPRPGDPHCFPSRMRTQVWHWNGTAFTASPWAVALLVFDFVSPRPLDADCSMTDWSTVHRVECATGSPPHLVDMNVNGGLRVCRGVGQNCISCGCRPRGAKVLAYGHQVDVGRFRCESLPTGVRCTVLKTGKGFLFTRRTTVRIG